MTIRFECEYNGRDFRGFQRQKNGITVQQVLEEALSRYLGQPVTIAASGRTDTGVHAKAQVCSFRLANPVDGLDMYRLEQGVNAFLPQSVAVRRFAVTNDDFSARFSVKSKTYVYRCYCGRVRSPLRDETAIQVLVPPNIDAMRQAADILSGTHDFTSFSSVRTDKECKIRTIHIDIQTNADEVIFTVSGNGFLRNMVRIIVGTLLEVGAGHRSVESIRTALQNRDRSLAGKTALARGLCLMRVEY